MLWSPFPAAQKEADMRLLGLGYAWEAEPHLVPMKQTFSWGSSR